MISLPFSNPLRFFIISLILLFNACNKSQNTNLIECGGSLDLSCPIGYFCKLTEDCGGIDNRGFCARIPQDCNFDEKTICGCDAREYQNECIANTMSITKKNSGRCIDDPALEINMDND